MEEKIARFVRELAGYKGMAELFHVDPPVGYDFDYDTNTSTKETNFVVVSATYVPFSGKETYIFPADEDGNVVDWGELDGSYRGGLDIKLALENAGYTVIRE